MPTMSESIPTKSIHCATTENVSLKPNTIMDKARNPTDQDMNIAPTTNKTHPHVVAHCLQQRFMPE